LNGFALPGASVADVDTTKTANAKTIIEPAAKEMDL
jgi:hypothetical protein